MEFAAASVDAGAGMIRRDCFMKIKRILAFMMAVMTAFALASCTKDPSETTASSGGAETTETATGTDAPETTGTAPIGSGEQTTASGTSETTSSSGGGEVPSPDAGLDIEYMQIGDYVTLVYNAATCEVEYEVERGLGSRQTVTLMAKMKDGFLFDGWSQGDALANATAAKPVNAVSKALTYSFEASYETTIYLNTSMTLVYDLNGGALSSGASDREAFSLVFYHNPSTRIEDGSFCRDGYTLVGYNTKPDGTGEDVSLGGRAQADGAPTLTLYCMWEQNTPESDFAYEVSGNTVTITGYTGTAQTVVIPESIDGHTVKKIAKGAFSNGTMKKAVIAKTVSLVEEGAFDGCASLETVVLYDGALRTAGSTYGICEESFSGCSRLANIRINTVYTLTDTWQSYTATSLDRLIWAADKKKLIIIGGSGAHYGFDCGILDEALGGEYEIINFGENANITSLLYFDLAEDFIQQGDIVLWAPEPGGYTLGSASCGYRFWDFRKSDYDFLKYIDVSLYSDLLSTFSDYCASLPLSRFKSFDAMTLSTNKYGDDVSARYWNGQRFSYSGSFSARPSAGEALSALVSKITEKGGSVYFSFAAMQRSGMESVSESEMLAYEQSLTSIPGIISISDYQDCIYDDELFYDSAWHMVNEGAKERTEQVAADLLIQLAKEGK